MWHGSAGDLLSQTMPASTFYHILVAFRSYLSGGQGLSANP
ncbi:hypothetical protein AADA15_19180 [Phycobacter sp. 'Weihai']